MQASVANSGGSLTGEDRQQIQVRLLERFESRHVVQRQCADRLAAEDERNTESRFLFVDLGQVDRFSPRVGPDVANDKRLLIGEYPADVPFARREASCLDRLPTEANAGPHDQFFPPFVQQVKCPFISGFDGPDGGLHHSPQHLIQVKGRDHIVANLKQ